MSVNREKPHVFVLPEDDANREIANGFQLVVSNPRQIQVLPPAGGWTYVLAKFRAEYEPTMQRYPERVMILLIDFDNNRQMRSDVQAFCDEREANGLQNRVFVLGSLDEPERLRGSHGTYETIGKNLAKDCRDDTHLTWGSSQFAHNAEELARIGPIVSRILFSP